MGFCSMMIGAVVGPVLGAGIPVKAKLALAFSTAKPVEESVDRLHFPLDNSVVDNAGSGGVDSLRRGWRLGPYHLDQRLA